MNKVVHKSTEWIYRGIWRGLVQWFRVPDQPPDLPVKPGEYIARFQPSEGFLKYLKFLFWVFLFVTDIVLTIAWIAASWALCANDLWWVSAIIAPFAITVIVLPDVIAYIAIHLRYDTTWYVMTDRSLRIRRGIWIIHETTITFENVQNIKVQQGPVQRHYGIANLVVETAGAGAAHGKGGQSAISNQGIIEGVSNAQELRDRILLRLKASKTAGLGDEDDRHALAHAAARKAVTPGGRGAMGPAHLVALREIRDELRQMA
jgi:membrane protein YdbS with pleckstrin-like domain